MEFMEVVKERYSCRSYDGRPVEPEKLAEILEAGRLAPTAKNLQEQRIYVVESPDGLAKIDTLTRCRYNAGTVLIVAFDKNNVFTYPGGKRDSGIEDASIITTHMMLAAKSVGVDSTWLNLIDPIEVKTAFNLPENEEVLCLLNLGYPNENAEPSQNHFLRKDLRETVKKI